MCLEDGDRRAKAEERTDSGGMCGGGGVLVDGGGPEP